MYDLIIVGGGTAGLACGLYASRYKLNVAIIAKEFGGTGNIAHRVDNWIGDPGISGYDLMQKFLSHVKANDVPLIDGSITAVTKDANRFTVTMENGGQHNSKMIVFANGMAHRKLGVPGEDTYTSKGVHYCYTCDGPFYKNKVMAIVGGSDAAAQAALFLADYGSKVFVIIRKDTLTAEPITSEKVYNHPKVEVVPTSNVKEILGDGSKVTSLKLDTGRELIIDALFVEIGHLPLNELAKSLGVETDPTGHIKVNKRQETNVEGVLAAGDLTDATELKQFITSAAEGSVAAYAAYHRLVHS
jgi:thioredoxin reductase (NADPH)